MKDEIVDAVECLAIKVIEAKDSQDALNLSQAASNLAEAVHTLELAKECGKQPTRHRFGPPHFEGGPTPAG